MLEICRTRETSINYGKFILCIDIVQAYHNWIGLPIQIKTMTWLCSTDISRDTTKAKYCELRIQSIGLYNLADSKYCLFILILGSTCGILFMQRFRFYDFAIRCCEVDCKRSIDAPTTSKIVQK